MALLSFVGLTTSVVGANAVVAPVGQGFTVTPSDLAFILKQIKIAERHAATFTPDQPCATLVGPGPDQIPDALTSYGLRTVDGSCNNLIPGREKFGATDQTFPRFTKPVFKDAETTPAAFGPPTPTSYKQKSGLVFDSQPREISNLIVDQTSTNPAAVAAAAFPVRTQGNPGLFPCITDPVPGPPAVDGVPTGCVPSHQTLFIPNVTTDVGLSPPYNSLFTFFGQFFDHGVDQTVKSGGTVFVPLHDDDPLIAGPDHILGNADDLPANQRFMVLTRAQNQPGPDGILGTADDIQDATNEDSPWVDQSQTYTSHASHQVFLREYVNNPAGKPVSTGKLLGGPKNPDGTPGPKATGMATWASVKAQAASLLGLQLRDVDVTNIPMLATDPYGKFVPGPNGLPQYVTATGLVEGNLTSPVPVPANALHFDTPFLTDIAHNADPGTVGPCTTAIGVTPRVPTGCLSPDADNVASADFANQPAGTYDDEMLNAHFCAGDGRVNENIALTTIHQVFHSEHDRLVDDMKATLLADAAPGSAGAAALAEWQLPAVGANGWNGERLFQAARFVTEMEYQHLVFEEFGRKVQPAIQPFHVYHSDINPAIHAEFAHAVYRFGHSMLDDTVARTNINGTDNSVPLLKAFLNPPEYFNGGSAGDLTPEQAAGSIVMGSADQTGNELDEFVTETLRNNLLGLPLDLPTINMTRARDAGVPPLNNVRRQIFAATNDGQLKPYTSWSDFGQHLKHPESLINFVAAYGTHPSITGQTTLAGKRAAAKAIVDPAPTDTTPIPTDAAEFMFGTGPTYASTADGVTTTGVDDVDLWVGGLAEITNLFGGLLGTTFNYVFENQMTDLQNGDRLYYLARTPGMNLRTQLEGNSFAEMIQRNTDGTHSLKADVFATADCKFQLSNLNGTPAGFTAFGSTVADDTTTPDCDESKLLLRKPDGTIQYRQVNSVDPVGINGQSVYNGTPGVDRIYGGNDNDTFWGGAGNDVIEGNGGDDVMLGGDGNDIITDLAGDDVLKGGPGNDALDGGIGNDIFMGGDGQDFINGGANDNETFAGPGNDFVIAGQGADAVFGDGGDDWIEGGSGQDLLIGDHGAPFFDDPAQVKPGNDIMIGQVGENDYDAEGGDDIMTANAAIDRFAGAAGFDWAIHQYDTVGADDDMMINNNLIGLPLPVVVNRDRWQETEANSGSAFNDTIRGDDAVPSAVGGAGFTGCDVLDQAGVDRINGLGALLPPLSGDLAAVVAASANKSCPLSGPIWGEGNILLGGAGNDTIVGRGGDDIIDGDRSLAVRISVRTNPADPSTEIGSADLMESQYKRDASGALFGPTLQADVFAGVIDPGNLVAVREILSPAAGTDTASVDTAVFSGPLSNYTIVAAPATGTTLASVKVTQTGANVAGQKVSDGIDTLRNIEMLQFSDQTVSVASTVAPPVPPVPAVPAAPAAPAIGAATAGTGSATVSFTAPAPNGSPAITSFEIVATPATGPAITVTGIPATATSGTVTGLTGGTAFTLQVRAVNANGPGPLSAASNPVTPTALDTVAPTVTARTPASGAFSASRTANLTAAFSEAVAPVTGTNFQLRGPTNALIPAVVSYNPLTRVATLNPNGSLANDTKYTVTLSGIRDLAGNTMATTTWSFTTGPGPTITATTPVSGATAVRRNANVTATFSEAITGFAVAGKVRIERVSNGVPFSSAVSFNALTRVLTINPTGSLVANTQYRVTITGGTTGVRDLAGNPLTTRVWTFTTGAAL
ncbi:peroxidase family protein [Pseudarthrobacter sp. H2]|uniref:peroxidase family protein n=1 Tax=Pseudarthrobacter sp. H2 TaxID=3418415 RepID=UPI003CF65D5D